GGGPVPAAERVARRGVAEPLGDVGVGAFEAARPQVLDEHPPAVGARGTLVDALELDHLSRRGPAAPRRRARARRLAGSSAAPAPARRSGTRRVWRCVRTGRSEEHTSELQSPYDLVCRLL